MSDKYVNLPDKKRKQIQGVPKVLKRLCTSTCRVTVLWHRIRQTIPQTKENEWKFCICLRGSPRQSGGTRCEPRKNERERAHSPISITFSSVTASILPISFAILSFSSASVSGSAVNTFSFKHPKEERNEEVWCCQIG